MEADLNFRCFLCLHILASFFIEQLQVFSIILFSLSGKEQTEPMSQLELISIAPSQPTQSSTDLKFLPIFGPIILCHILIPLYLVTAFL